MNKPTSLVLSAPLPFASSSASPPSGMVAFAAFCIFAVLGALSAPLAVHADRIIHEASGKCIHPADFRVEARTRLMVHERSHGRDCAVEKDERGGGKESALEFRYDPKAKRIRHSGGQCFIPERGGLEPTPRSKVILGPCHSPAAEFEFRSGKYFRHVSGKCLHILPGRGTTWVTLNNGASVILDTGCLGERITWRMVKLRRLHDRPASNLLHRFSGLCAVPKARNTHTGNVITLVAEDCDRQLPIMSFQLLGNGAIRHQGTGKCVHPHGNRLDPGNNTRMVLHESCTDGRTVFRHLESGALQHQLTGKCIHPRGARRVPGEGTELVLHNGCDGKALEFQFLPFAAQR
ncbi:MAG: hypothetical protein ACR2P7_01815 [bacterium]